MKMLAILTLLIVIFLWNIYILKWILAVMYCGNIWISGKFGIITDSRGVFFRIFLMITMPGNRTALRHWDSFSLCFATALELARSSAHPMVCLSLVTSPTTVSSSLFIYCTIYSSSNYEYDYPISSWFCACGLAATEKWIEAIQIHPFGSLCQPS